MRGTEFPEANTKLLPPEGEEESVYALHVWRHPDGGLVISKWKMTWRERLQCLLFGHVWFMCWGNTHPPMNLEAKYPFATEADGLRRSLKWAVPIGIILWAIICYFAWEVFFK